MHFTIFCHIRYIISTLSNHFAHYSIYCYKTTHIPKFPCKIAITHFFIGVHFTHITFFTNTHTLTNIKIHFLLICITHGIRDTCFKRIKVTLLCFISHFSCRHTRYTFCIRVTFSSRYNLYVIKSIIPMSTFYTIICVE